MKQKIIIINPKEEIKKIKSDLDNIVVNENCKIDYLSIESNKKSWIVIINIKSISYYSIFYFA